MTYPTFTGAPALIPAWRRPFVAWRTRQANAARDRAIAAAIEAMDALTAGDQFHVCICRIQLLCDADAIPPHTMTWWANAMGRMAHMAGRRG